jgi:hypothetical protein
MEDVSFKECPFCKKKIRKEAVKCRFCGEWLEQNVQTKPSGEIPASEFPKVEDPPAIGSKEAKHETIPPVKKEISQKTLYWISTALLAACGVIVFAGFASVHWNGLSPAKQGETIANVTIGLFKVLFVAVVISRFEKRKGYRLLNFSVVFAVCTAIGIYYFFDARHKAQAEKAVADRQYVSDLNNLQEFLKQGAVGDIPTFKLTGDADDDAISQVMNDFYRNYIQAYREANSAMLKLNAVDVFDNSVLTNKFNLQLEIDNRTAGRQIIETLASNTSSMLTAAGKEYESQNVSEESKKGVRKVFDNLTPQFNTMFAWWVRKQNADQVLLQFLNDNFGDFELKDGKIVFGNQANVQRYAELAKNIQDAMTEVQGLQTQAAARVDAIKAKVQ